MTDNRTQQTIDPREHELGYFIRLANDCCNESLQELDEPLRFLASIDALYMNFFEAGGGIKPPATAILLLNAHSSLRASVRLALSGQLLPVFMTLRGAIESSLYANAMVVDPKLQQVWLDRDKDKNSRDVCRSKFSIKKMFNYLEQAHDRRFTDGLREVYDTTIDFGAHPNNCSIVRSVRIEDLGGDSAAINFAYIHGVGSFELLQSLVACADVGLAVFFVALICFEGHPRVAELNERALELQGQESAFVEALGLSKRQEG